MRSDREDAGRKDGSDLYQKIRALVTKNKVKESNLREKKGKDYLNR